MISRIAAMWRARMRRCQVREGDGRLWRVHPALVCGARSGTGVRRT